MTPATKSTSIRSPRLVGTSSALLALALVASLAACSGPPATSEERTDRSESAESAERIVARLADIASEHGGNRATGTPGGVASGELILDELRAMGLEPEVRAFDTPSGEQGRNIIVDLVEGDGDELVILGTHYDSVESGPGIADNASGVAALLAASAGFIEHRPDTPSDASVRLAFWDAEEDGLAGSSAYVAGEAPEAIARTSYINFDMVASTGSDYQILDGGRRTLTARAELDPESFAPLLESLPAVPEGADALDDLVRDAFSGAGELDDAFHLSLASDIAPFLMSGYRTSGVSVLSTEDGVPVESFITCYHAACDDLDNIDLDSLARSTDAMQALIGTLVEPR